MEGFKHIFKKNHFIKEFFRHHLLFIEINDTNNFPSIYTSTTLKFVTIVIHNGKWIRNDIINVHIFLNVDYINITMTRVSTTPTCKIIIFFNSNKNFY